jgi:hypothetical protein
MYGVTVARTVTQYRQTVANPDSDVDMRRPLLGFETRPYVSLAPPYLSSPHSSRPLLQLLFSDNTTRTAT